MDKKRSEKITNNKVSMAPGIAQIIISIKGEERGSQWTKTWDVLLVYL